MEFRKEFFIKPFEPQINLRSRILLIGSCFTENLGLKLSTARFNVLINPNGILFNPASISQALHAYADNQIDTSLVFKNQDWFNSWDHHSIFSHHDHDALINMIKQATNEAHIFLQDAEWLIITLGSAWVYTLSDGKVVANCHKIPADKFHKRLMQPSQLQEMFAVAIEKIRSFNSNLNIILTISPVRHLRDGFVENNRSKAVLIQAVHDLTERFSFVHYFPAYELIIDDLRDYRFFAEDMAHPNFLATEYVWQKFTQSYLDKSTREWLPKIHGLNLARSHKPLHPFSAAHASFRKKQLEIIHQLKDDYPFIDWSADIHFFSDQ